MVGITFAQSSTSLGPIRYSRFGSAIGLFLSNALIGGAGQFFIYVSCRLQAHIPIPHIAGANQAAGAREKPEFPASSRGQRLVVAGDVVYNDVHLHLAESNAQTRREWIAALEKIESLNPRAVTAGHKRPWKRRQPQEH